MPELAEVETIRRQLEKFEGSRILAVETDGSERFASAAFSEGLKFKTFRRRGKYIIAELENGEVLKEMILHFGMTGSLRRNFETNRFRVRWTLDSSDILTLTDPRGFGRAEVVEPGDYHKFPGLNRLGPEPLENFDPEPFIKEFFREGAPVKVRLLSQKVMAGIGNYVADESLWLAKINPQQRQLTRRQSLNLIKALKSVFEEGIENGGMSMRDYVQTDGSEGSMKGLLKVYGRAGEKCLRCSTTLDKITVAGRGTTWCPKCQKIKV